MTELAYGSSRHAHHIATTAGMNPPSSSANFKPFFPALTAPVQPVGHLGRQTARCAFHIRTRQQGDRAGDDNGNAEQRQSVIPLPVGGQCRLQGCVARGQRLPSW